MVDTPRTTKDFRAIPGSSLSMSFSMDGSHSGAPALGQDNKIQFPLFISLCSQFAHNLHLFKLRALHCVDVLLTGEEENILLKKDKAALERITQTLENELNLLEHSLRSRPWPQAEDEVIDIVNNIFRFAFEEFSLRYKAHGEDRDAKDMPQRTLQKAVEHQRKLMDEAVRKLKQSDKKVQGMQTLIADLERQHAAKDKKHKEDLDSFLKEICCLKEQLYRSYKDKEYVGKPVDMMRWIQDDDTGDDVSVDELLNCRRVVRGIEHQMAQFKEKISNLQGEIQAKQRFIKKMEEKMSGNEIVIDLLRKDVNALNSCISRLETQNHNLIDEVNNLSVEKNTLTRENDEFKREKEEYTANQHAKEIQTDPVPMVSPYDMGSDLIPESHREHTRLALYREIRDKTSEVGTLQTAKAQLEKEKEEMAKAAKEQFEELTEQIEDLERDNKKLKTKLEEAERLLQESSTRIKDLESQVERAELKAKEAKIAQEKAELAQRQAEAAQKEAEDRAAVAAERCATQSDHLVAELTKAHALTEQLQIRNSCLCQAYLNINERLDEIRTRAGLKDYKRRANEFHHQRAEKAIQEMREEMKTREEECEKREEDALKKTEFAEHKLRHIEADIEMQQVAHSAEIEALTSRTGKVTVAFESLLADFNRMREDYLKMAGTDAQKILDQGRASDQLKNNDTLDFDVVKGRQRFVFENKVGHATPTSLSSSTQIVSGLHDGSKPAVSLSANDERLLATTKFIHGVAKTTSEAKRLRQVKELEEAQDFNSAFQPVETDKTPLDPSLSSPASPTVPAPEEELLKKVNDSAITLSSVLGEAFAEHFQSLLGTFSEIIQLERFLSSKKEALEKVEQEAEQKVSALGVKRDKRSLMETHQKLLAQRDLATEKAGFREQTIVAAWDKIRLYQSLEQGTRVVIDHIRKLFVQSGLARLDPAQDVLGPPLPIAQRPLPMSPEDLQSQQSAADGTAATTNVDKVAAAGSGSFAPVKKGAARAGSASKKDKQGTTKSRRSMIMSPVGPAGNLVGLGTPRNNSLTPMSLLGELNSSGGSLTSPKQLEIFKEQIIQEHKQKEFGDVFSSLPSNAELLLDLKPTTTTNNMSKEGSFAQLATQPTMSPAHMKQQLAGRREQDSSDSYGVSAEMALTSSRIKSKRLTSADTLLAKTQKLQEQGQQQQQSQKEGRGGHQPQHLRWGAGQPPPEDFREIMKAEIKEEDSVSYHSRSFAAAMAASAAASGSRQLQLQAESTSLSNVHHSAIGTSSATNALQELLPPVIRRPDRSMLLNATPDDVTGSGSTRRGRLLPSHESDPSANFGDHVAIAYQMKLLSSQLTDVAEEAAKKAGERVPAWKAHKLRMKMQREAEAAGQLPSTSSLATATRIASPATALSISGGGKVVNSSPFAKKT